MPDGLISILEKEESQQGSSPNARRLTAQIGLPSPYNYIPRSNQGRLRLENRPHKGLFNLPGGGTYFPLLSLLIPGSLLNIRSQSSFLSPSLWYQLLIEMLRRSLLDFVTGYGFHRLAHRWPPLHNYV